MRTARRSITALVTVLVTMLLSAPGASAAAPELLSLHEFPATTTTQEVRVNPVVSAAGGICLEVRVANEDGWGNWNQCKAQPHLLSPGYGYKGVFVQVRNDQLEQSNTLFVRTHYVQAAAAAPEAPAPAPAPEAPAPAPAVDANAPYIKYMEIPATTTTQTIAVRVDGTDVEGVTHMRLANEDGNWQPWKPYESPAQHTLSAGYGYKGVYAQVKDAAGNLSNVTYRRTTFLAGIAAPIPAGDLAAPKVNSVTLPATTATRTITAAINASDDKGVTMMRLANEDGNWQAWKPFTANATHTLSAGAGIKGVFVQVRDAAGKESNVVFTKTRLTTTTLAVYALRTTGTMGADRLTATSKSETVRAAQFDGKRDVIDCGRGRDTVIKRAEDRTRNCERVIVATNPFK